MLPGRLVDPKIEGAAFPSLQAAMIQNMDPTISLRVLRDTTVTTLSSILRGRFNWDSVNGRTSRGRVAGINQVYIDSQATLSQGTGSPNAFFKPRASCVDHIHLANKVEQGGSDGEARRLKASIRALQTLVLPASNDAVDLERTQLTIRCDDEQSLFAWLKQVRFRHHRLVYR